MRMPLRDGCICLAAAVFLLGSSSARAGDAKQAGPQKVVLKSLHTKLRAEDRVIGTKGAFLRYRVEAEKGEWLWLVADCGIRGWVRRQDVVPVEEAIAFFSAAVASEHQSARAYHMLGLAYHDRKEYRRAIRNYNFAIELDPSFGAAFVDRCYTKLAKLDLKGAMADANEAIRLDAKSANAYQCRAFVWDAEERYDEAIADYDTAIRLDASDRMLLVQRSNCWSQKGDLDRAIADATEAIRLEPTLTLAYLVRSKYRGRKQEYELELADASAAVKLNPHSPSVYLFRAIASWDKDNFQRALADCDEAIRLDPKDPVIHLVRGIILANKGEFGQALGEVIFHPLLRNSPSRIDLLTILH